MDASGISERALVFLFELVFSGREAKMSELDKTHREALLRAGLIELEKRGRTTYLHASDKGWTWVDEHLAADLKRTQARAAFVALLARVRDYLRAQDLPLAEFVRPRRAQTEALPIEQLVRNACLSLGSGTTRTRVRLADLRGALPALSRTQLDDALLEMMRRRELALFPIDNRRELKPEDDGAALDLSGVPHHVVYLEA